MTDRESDNLNWGKVVAQSLWQAGIRTVCLSPGSRSTPLVLGLYLVGKIEILVHVDERSAGFFALGMAKVKSSPVALLCTSGTAPAHYFPAIIEASNSHIPLVVLTTDRPPELRDCGAPQTIDQMHLFGHFVRFFGEVGTPSGNERHLATLIQFAVARSMEPISGPVHLNFALCEPLSPRTLDHSPLQFLPQWQILPTQTTLNCLELLLSTFRQYRRGIIVVGVTKTPIGWEQIIHQLADILGYPLLVEATGIARESTISHYDSFLRSGKLQEILQPEIIIRFGAMPTSKSYFQWLEKYPQCQQITIDSYDNNDPSHGNNWQIPMGGEYFCKQVIEFVSSEIFIPNLNWIKQWQNANQITQNILDQWMLSIPEIFEGKIYDQLSRSLPTNTIVYIGNSTPIRDLDTFFHNSQSITVLANRGANGIDGMISCALGAAKASSNPVLLICGDLTFYHDLNGLLATKLHQIPLTILLLDNQGGAIFEMLPISQYDPPFEQLFATPIGIDFSAIVKGYGATYIEVNTYAEIITQVNLSLPSSGVQVIAIKTDRKQDWQYRRYFWHQVLETIEAELKLPN